MSQIVHLLRPVFLLLRNTRHDDHLRQTSKDFSDRDFIIVTDLVAILPLHCDSKNSPTEIEMRTECVNDEGSYDESNGGKRSAGGDYFVSNGLRLKVIFYVTKYETLKYIFFWRSFKFLSHQNISKFCIKYILFFASLLYYLISLKYFSSLHYFKNIINLFLNPILKLFFKSQSIYIYFIYI